MDAEKYVDLAGNPVKVGDIICYAALWDRSAHLKYGLVVRLAERDAESWQQRQGIHIIPTLRAIIVDRMYDFRDGELRGHVWKLQKEGKEVALGFLDRTLVVRQDQVPDEVLHIFDLWRDMKKVKKP